MKRGAMVTKKQSLGHEKETHLTVMKTSLFFVGDGFSAYDSAGKLVFRVDTYNSGYSGDLVLMDAVGRCLITVRRKMPSLHRRWEGFIGERIAGMKPSFSVHRSGMVGRSKVTLEVRADRGGAEYSIEGSFASRRCAVLDSEKEAVVEIRRKVSRSSQADVVLGKDTFQVSVKRGFDVALAMGLVLVLDRIDGAAGEYES